ncbi:MAG: A/G-specific adenine glycosylase [Pedosphaera sp.]|nr:A/G-specific adenine glycosylase [Pedosphaera sp.]
MNAERCRRAVTQHSARDLKVQVAVRRLLGWFRGVARDLPWRRTRDPYGIWISEVMLQQTQVKTVVPYWERWMQRLPDIRALATASEEPVLKLWEGLGYYSRARNLLRAAREIMTRHDGRFPEEFKLVLQLPGIGRYTAGAICSIAFNQPTPIVDGNIIRVLTRYYGIAGDPKSRKINADLWRRAETWVQTAAVVGKSKGRACSDLNQAMMELGAMLCTPTGPRCNDCPLRTGCVAFRKGRVDRFPERALRVPTVSLRYSMAIVEKSGKILVQQRAADAVNGGLWEFPHLELAVGNGVAVEPLARWLRISSDEFRAIGILRHSITHHRITQEIFAVRAEKWWRLPTETAGHWVTRQELDTLALTGPLRRWVDRRLDALI